MNFKVRVNNEPFLSFESGSLTRSIRENTGMWSLTSSVNDNTNFPIKTGDYVQILINDIIKCTGYVDEIQNSMSVDSHTITAAGRDNVQDIIDSSVPDKESENIKVNEGPVSLQALCQKILNSINSDIKIINKVSGIAEFTTKDLQSAEPGCKAMEFLVSFARKRQVYLVTDGQGNLLIYRPLREKSSTSIVHEFNNHANNVLLYDSKVSESESFNTYICKSQDNFGYDDNADYSSEGTSRNGKAVDKSIRASRYLEIQAEESMDDRECQKRAVEICNLKRAEQNEYRCTIQGFAQNDGTLWDFGQQVQISDDYAGVKGSMVITRVKYNYDIQSGSLTELVFSPVDAYQVIEEQTLSDKRKSNLSMDFKRDINDPEYIDSWRTRRKKYNRLT